MRKELEKLESFKVMDVLEKAKEFERKGISIIHLEVGEPDFPTPPPVVEGLKEALNMGETKYTESLGIPELREAISKRYMKDYGVRVSLDNIAVTAGTSPAMLLAFGCLVGKRDEVIIPNPSYPCYFNFVRFLGGKVVSLRVTEENQFLPDPEEIKKLINKKTCAIVINSPSNPTGTVYPPELIKEIASLGIPVISDEVYHGLHYEGDVTTCLKFTEECFIINGFSKKYSMTGWRLGYLIAPSKYMKYIQKMEQNFFISANAFVQRAGIAALEKCDEYLIKMREEFRKRRDVMREEILKTGFNVSYIPKGAFYYFINARKIFKNSLMASFELLEKAHVSVAPGIDFGNFGEGYLRFSYSTSIENIREGFRRIRKYMGI